MKNEDTRVAAHPVRAGGRTDREIAAARAMLHRPQSDRDAAIEAAASRVLERLAHHKPRRGLVRTVLRPLVRTLRRTPGTGVR
ncbi:MAG: hypothetical protein IT437_12050 [Phycisphaerales bacterium]|nr:hypothetical protein [Phycisphaerales bacterium]